ncbi:MAG: 4-hydroxy-tetrahydrodipicolinate reductase, partial [Candidatus Omnitrophica bacterium]|nr:4-hydroxy-tetrahydrodipicolinate reductase [Candidatus Omnitrophota bacterium]
MIRLAMAGALGRMGRTILSLALKDKEFRITGALEQAGRSEIGADIGPFLGVSPLGVEVSADMETVLKRSDVLIDFTSFSATAAHLAAAKKTGTGYVLGTTALPESVLAKIKLASKKIPIVQSPNMSIGVNLLFKLSEIAAKVLDESYDMEMMEIHHRSKKDAPSGTAMKLLEVVAK